MPDKFFEIAGKKTSEAERTLLLSTTINGGSHESSIVTAPENQPNASSSSGFHIGGFFKLVEQYETISSRQKKLQSYFCVGNLLQVKKSFK